MLQTSSLKILFLWLFCTRVTSIVKLWKPFSTSPYLLGTYLLRKTNDNGVKTNYAYLILNENDNIKFKTIIQNGVFATKISKTGHIEYKINIKNVCCAILGIRCYDIIVRFNNVNKYTYSFFGIEFPEIRYKQISNYNTEKIIVAKNEGNCIYIKDKNGLYYLFDLYANISTNRLPYVETPFNTLIVTQIISFIINLFLVKSVQYEFGNM
jgi:hypothetical protein